MRSFFAGARGFLIAAGLGAPLFFGQGNAAPPDAPAKTPATAPSLVEPPIPLRATSTKNLSSELGGAFMPPVKCDADGNLYIRKFALNRPRGPVIKIDADGKPTAVFDPAAFSALALDRVDAFSPAGDGGIYQIAQSRHTGPGGQTAPDAGNKPRIYVLHYSSDGSPSSPARLDADFEIYTFAAFTDGNFLVSGMQRDPLDKNDHGRGVTKVFSADGAELAQLTFREPKKGGKTAGVESGSKPGSGSNPPAQKDATPEPPGPVDKPAGAVDLKDAEVSRDGNLYVMRSSSQALVDVIAPGGKITKTLKIASPMAGAVPVSFHVSENRLALLFSNTLSINDSQNNSNNNASNKEKNEPQGALTIVVADAQTGRKIAVYSSSADLGSFACYSANEGAFTFLKHAEGNAMEVIRAEP